MHGKKLESGAHGGNLKNQCETVDAVLGIGTNLPEKAFHFTGAIDELGIFNVALTEEEIKKIITEDEAFDAPIPAGIERYMKKFIAAVQGARLNRRRTGAILGRVVVAMNIEPSDLMKYVRMVKKGL